MAVKGGAWMARTSPARSKPRPSDHACPRSVATRTCSRDFTGSASTPASARSADVVLWTRSRRASGQARTAGGRRLLDEREAEARLAAARHPDAHRVRREIVRREEDGLPAREPQVEDAELLEVHGRALYRGPRGEPTGGGASSGRGAPPARG